MRTALRIVVASSVPFFGLLLSGCQGHLPPGVPSQANHYVPQTLIAQRAATSIAMKHVQTATYLFSSTEAATAPSTYAPYLTWAFPLFTKMFVTHQAGIKTILAINPVMPENGEYEYTNLTGTYPSVEAADCSGNTITTYNGNGLLADPRAAQATAYYASVVNYYIQNKLDPYSNGTQDWSAFFVDNNGALYGASATPCNYAPGTWGQAFDNGISTIAQKFVSNSLATTDSNTQTFVNRLSAPNIIGGMFEECFNDTLWTAEEDSQLETVALLKSEGKPAGPGWWCYLDNISSDGATVIPLRLFAYASFLLTYDPNYSVWQTSFTTPSTFKVMPETGFVPLSPLTHPTSISNLKSSTGAYFRQYSSCYYRGSLVGSCEIVVNPGTSTVSIPNASSYTRSAVISGSGVLDGGSMSFSGARPTSLAAGRAAILIH
jgi:hypothetical protein